MVLICAAWATGCGNTQGSNLPDDGFSNALTAGSTAAMVTPTDETVARPLAKPQGVMELKFNSGKGIDTGIAESAGSLYFGADDTLIAVDEVSGQERWRLPTGAELQATPRADSGTVYFASNEFPSGEKNGYHVYAVDAAIGQEKWRFAAASDVMTIEAADGVVYAAGTQALYALDAATGRQIWTQGHGALFISTSDPSTLFVADMRLTGPNQNTTYIYALGKADGQEKWEIQSGGAPSGLLAYGGVLYLATFGEREGASSMELPPALFALDAASGQQRWMFAPEGGGSGSPGGSQSMSISRVDGARLYLFNEDMNLSSSLVPTGDRTLIEIDTATGQQIAGNRVAGGCQIQNLNEPAPTFLDGVFYIASADLGAAANDSNSRITYSISAVAAASGGEQWQVSAQADTRMLLSYAGLFNGVFYLAARDSGEIFALH